ncbi:MAG: PQQ-binding-like beta-propeller repeat protein [Planctomycetes bacterium]|nr:PQQ-binding-like beta-propeller repeat protein [Planctomycetota bacterium]
MPALPRALTGETAVSSLAGAIAAAAGAAALAWWLSLGPPIPPSERRQAAAPSEGDGAAGPAVALEGALRTFDGRPSALRGSWPRFRGEGFDNVAADAGPLAEAWPGGGPAVLWSVGLGEGHAGPAVRDGRVFVLDYDEQAPGDSLRCFSLDDGREIWRRTYEIRVKRNHGMSRTVPAVSERFVAAVGPRCHAVCLEAATGAFRWGIDLVRDWGARVPMWYTGQCPLIDGGAAVLAPGGKALLIGVDLETGRVLWETPNPRGWQMSHASVVPMTVGGRRTYVYAALGGVAGIAADGPDRGAVLWETDAWKPAVQAPSPLPLGRDRFLITAGYGSGSMVFEASPARGRFQAAPVRKLDRREFACEQHTPVLFRDRLYAVLPKDAGPAQGQLVCADPSGTRIWASGPGSRFGLGPYLIADGKVLALSEDGTLTMARAGGDRFELLGRAKVLHGRDAWAPMAVAGSRLLLRDWKTMICLDLREKG